MKTTRTEFTIKFSVDLDPIPGAFHEGNDWREMIIAHFTRIAGHYDAQAEVVDIREFNKRK